MNAWTPKPTEPGLYLYDSEHGQRLPVTWDGRNCWIVLPPGTAVYGRRAIMFRPAHGLFWRIPDPPPVSVKALAGVMDVSPPMFSGSMAGGASFEMRPMPPQPPRPMMPLIRVEETAGMLDSHMPITGPWGWGKDLPECPPAMFKPGRCIDAMKEGQPDAT